MALIIKTSQLPSSGKGLFTTKAIPKEGKVIEYRGEVIDYKEFRRRAKLLEDHYMFYVRPNLYIDAKHTLQYKARYANDAQGMTRVKGLRNNCEYVLYGDRCFIVAKRDIKAGEEILVDYTKPYWDDFRKRIKRAK